MKKPVYEIHLPEYHHDSEPDHVAIGAKIDDEIKRLFMGQYLGVRCITLADHPDKFVDEMIDIIQSIGHDRYDPNRPGDRYENNEGKHIDLFCFDYHVGDQIPMLESFVWTFYRYRTCTPIDLILLLDPTKLNQVFFTYAGREDEGERSDGWTFKDPDNTQDILVAILRIRHKESFSQSD